MQRSINNPNKTNIKVSFPSPWAHDVFKPFHKNTPTETSKKLNGSITGCHHLDVRLTSGKSKRNINKTEIKAEIGQRRAKTTIRPTIAWQLEGT